MLKFTAKKISYLILIIILIAIILTNYSPKNIVQIFPRGWV